MLLYDTAKDIYEEMKENVAGSSKSGIESFYKMFLKSAVDYANTRASWACMDQDARNEDDRNRRIQHDGFISLLSALSRNLGMENIEEIMPDRKTKGDFACYIALFLALEQR